MDNKLTKLGELTIIEGEYTDKNGDSKKRYRSVGTVFGTPDKSRMSIKFHATLTTPERWASVFFDDKEEKDNVPTEGEIPFQKY